MPNFFKYLILFLSVFSSIGFFKVNQAFACGEKTDCTVDNGVYRIYIPETAPREGKIPALLYIHGLGGSAAGVITNPGFRKVVERLGIALIAAHGRAGSWSFPNSVKRGNPRNEFTYFSAIRTDIIKRFSIDERKIVAGGFSIGASMVWNLACHMPEDYTGFIPIAGTLWRPQPQKCAAPIGEVYHTHGLSDRVFPLEGRVVKGKRQGAILDTFDILYRQDRCSRKLIKEIKERGQQCKYHENCGGETMRLCFHKGFHSVKASYLEDGFLNISEKRGWLKEARS